MEKTKETKEMLEHQSSKELQDVQKALLSVVEDLDAEKAKSEEARARIEAILMSIGDGLVVVDKNGKITLVNNAFESLLGWKKDEVIGKDIAKVIPREDEKKNVLLFKKGVLSQVLADKKVAMTTCDGYTGAVVCDWYGIRKDKTRFPASSTSAPIRIHGKVVGAVEVFRDTTREKELDLAKTEFLSLAAHQLRTPLSSTKWVLELFMQDESLTEKQKERLDNLYSSNQRLINLVNSLLNAARIEAGRLIANKKMVDIAKLIHAAYALCKPNADRKKQKINVVIKTEIKKTNIDPMFFSETLNILLANAVGYGSENSDIDLICDEKDGNYVIAVHNVGSFIPKTDRKALFGKFYRGVHAQNIRTAGSGLGLFIAKGTVEANGGTIWFESDANSGTTFYFTVPMK